MTDHPDATQMEQATAARALLDVLGLDVMRPGRVPDQGMATAVVGPTTRGWKVTIDLAAFDRLVAPALRAALDAEVEKTKP